MKYQKPELIDLIGLKVFGDCTGNGSGDIDECVSQGNLAVERCLNFGNTPGISCLDGNVDN